MDTWPIIILANDQKCCYYQSSIQYIARIITTILHHNRDTTEEGSGSERYYVSYGWDFWKQRAKEYEKSIGILMDALQ